MTLKVYSFNHRYKKNVTCRTESLDLDAIKDAKERMDADPNTTTQDITVNTKEGFLYCDLTCEMLTVNFIRGEAIVVGERHMDARCSGRRRFFTMPELESEAKLQFQKECKVQKELADGYYSQPWV